jgi:hypothetical protein
MGHLVKVPLGIKISISYTKHDSGIEFEVLNLVVRKGQRLPGALRRLGVTCRLKTEGYVWSNLKSICRLSNGFFHKKLVLIELLRQMDKSSTKVNVTSRRVIFLLTSPTN